MMIKYTGDGKYVSLITGEIYRAKKIFDKMGEGYIIFDEGDDWYRYGVQFVEKNFEVVAENEDNAVDVSERLLRFA